MNLNELRPAAGSKRERRRVGRGHGTGWGKTAGKGHNGQKQRSGSYVSPIFEGGQMPIIRRIPKRGFSNAPFKKDIIAITLSDIVEKFNDGDVVSLETLVENGIVKNPKFIKKYSDEVLRNIKGRRAVKEYLNSNIEAYVKEKEFTSLLKIIGNTEVNKKLTVKAHRISKAAKELIEKAGGSVELLEIKSYSAKAGNNKKEDGDK
ncbi:ribosomal protein L15 [Leptotrichia wadei]|uniref:Large ribosomal subunit protein uL15 n=3 Tax=Leptotrichia wadei TaxID=157687 RepID=A0A134APH0_9FUSO|nr:50S ribosomal protein L15 [Leptotrichia wadei]ERK53799.1 ribosomal protein L15 [Leptotrichia wadei F0279]KXB69585.1 ribosomal protein L15 [Leptotrichia wadei]BBM43721.1 50S ribosomal protein L15 [Leptotrichia wadei]BBM48557.1 50S ribosomal protein L15 [Leptotrichia wadei]